MANKQEVLEVMGGDSFEDYLKSIDLFRDSLDDGSIKQEELDQEIIERACAVMAIEKWATHADYVAMLQKMVDTLPEYQDLLEIEDTRDHMAGLAVFINGLGQSSYDISGFGYNEGMGFLLCQTAIGFIMKYLKSQGREKDAEVFDEFHQWFERIYTAQVVLGYALMAITTWNESMALGFYNILTISQISYQGRMLNCLYQVTEDPVVKKNIFEEYLGVLERVHANAVEEGKEDVKKDVEYIIDMVNRKARGED